MKKLIILRGLPGCGKSIIAEKLSEKLNSMVIYGDSFKREFMISNIDFKNKDVYEYAHNKILKELKKMFAKGKELVIIEELFENKNFVNSLKDFCDKNEVEIQWFYIQRDLEKLLEIENKRERKIKNTIKDFKKLQKDLEDIKNEGEIIVDNNGDLNDTINFVLKNLEN